MMIYEFQEKSALIEAARKAQMHGSFEVYSPLPEDDLLEEFSPSTKLVSYAAIAGAILGASLGFGLQFLQNYFQYSLNIGGRPLNSWPAFLIITFELGVLTCGFFILGSFIFLNRLPRFDRKVFDLQAFNERRHIHYFLTTEQELTDVKALASYQLAGT